ncbi:hypothetical protein DRN34_03185 [Thermococci archaeon]|nr:MAG: hypothetical protein DRN34_03185 [Thermococci archaeon]HDD36638.1 hypothetical protein [Archaeoglobus veneficus]
MDREAQEVIEFYHGYFMALVDVCIHSTDLDEETIHELLYRGLRRILHDIERKKLLTKIKNE